MGRGKEKKHKSDSKEIPISTWLTPRQIEEITTGTDEFMLPISDERKLYLEKLANAFGLIPDWKKNT